MANVKINSLGDKALRKVCELERRSRFDENLQPEQEIRQVNKKPFTRYMVVADPDSQTPTNQTEALQPCGCAWVREMYLDYNDGYDESGCWKPCDQPPEKIYDVHGQTLALLGDVVMGCREQFGRLETFQQQGTTGVFGKFVSEGMFEVTRCGGDTGLTLEAFIEDDSECEPGDEVMLNFEPTYNTDDCDDCGCWNACKKKDDCDDDDSCGHEVGCCCCEDLETEGCVGACCHGPANGPFGCQQTTKSVCEGSGFENGNFLGCNTDCADCFTGPPSTLASFPSTREMCEKVKGEFTSNPDCEPCFCEACCGTRGGNFSETSPLAFQNVFNAQGQVTSGFGASPFPQASSQCHEYQGSISFSSAVVAFANFISVSWQFSPAGFESITINNIQGTISGTSTINVAWDCETNVGDTIGDVELTINGQVVTKSISMTQAMKDCNTTGLGGAWLAQTVFDNGASLWTGSATVSGTSVAKPCCESVDPIAGANMKQETNGGPGTELMKLLSGWGLRACSTCRAYAKQMDQWGPDECENRKDEILDWLKSQAKRKKIPFFKVVAKGFVDKAIRISRE